MGYRHVQYARRRPSCPSQSVLTPNLTAIIVPICATPILLTLGIGMRKTKAQAAELKKERARPQLSLQKKALAIFWQLDIIGLILLVAGFGMLLTIVTIANGKGSHWNDRTFNLVSRATLFPTQPSSSCNPLPVHSAAEI